MMVNYRKLNLLSVQGYLKAALQRIQFNGLKLDGIISASARKVTFAFVTK